MKPSEDLSKAERKRLKAQRRAEKDQRKFEKSTSQAEYKETYTILCVRFGNKYGIEYVERLRNMVQRHCTLPYEFVCLTDDPTKISGVRNIVQPNAGYTKGWWHKVHMFDPGLPLRGRILYLDLDVVIIQSIDKILTHKSDKFLGIRDFNRKFYSGWKKLNSSVLAWNAGTNRHIYEDFKKSPKQAMNLHGDQDWIYKTCHSTIEYFPDSWLKSYKWEIRSKQDLHIFQGKRNFKDVKNNVDPGIDCCIAVFHGDPNPNVVQDKIVVDNWR